MDSSQAQYKESKQEDEVVTQTEDVPEDDEAELAKFLDYIGAKDGGEVSTNTEDGHSHVSAWPCISKQRWGNWI